MFGKIKSYALIAMLLGGTAVYTLAINPNTRIVTGKTVNASQGGANATFNQQSGNSGSIEVNSRRASDGNSLLKTATLNVPAKAPARAESTGSVELYGTLLYSTKLESGLYKIPTATGQSFEQKTNATRPAKYGAAVVDRTFMYPVQLAGQPLQMYNVNIDGWTTGTPADITDEACGTAVVYDPTTDCVYGCYYYDEFTQCGFGIGHYPSGHVTMIKDLNKELFSALAVDASGQLWAMTLTGKLYKVDKTSGDVTLIGNTGIVSQYNTSGAIDPATGIFYYAQSNDSGGYLYSIDTKTAEATLLMTFPSEEEIGGMFVRQADYDTAVPAAPTGLQAVFEDGASNGKVKFTMPSLTYGGSQVRGNINYTVRANGKILATGEAEPGKEVTVDVSVAGATHYTFSVFAHNAGGEGPRTRVCQFVGKDKPAVPNVKATYNSEENAIVVTWNPVESGVAGGYIDASKVTYTVTRLSDNAVVAENITATSFKDTSYGSGSKFQYSVVASVDGQSSEAGLSNVVDMTVKYPPYLETFETKDPFTDDYTFIGSGKGDNKWTYYKSGKNLRAYYDFDIPKDEWLITPAIMLEAGKKYKFSFTTYTGNANYVEHLEVYMGNECSIAGMSKKLVDKKWASKTPETVEVVVSPTETGKYYFGFHACSDEDCSYIYLDDISVSAPTGENVPEVCGDVVITPGEKCVKTAEISFKAPAKTIKGNDITTLDKVEVYRGSQLINTIEKAEGGKTYTINDEVTVSGTYTYYIYAYNEDGMGAAAKASAYIGIPAPCAPTNVVLTENSTPGNVTIKWDAPTSFADGQAMMKEFLTYQVKYGKQLIESDITNTSATFQAISPSSQEFLSFDVLAVTEGGSSDISTSNLLLVGSPAAAPYKESFANAQVKSPIANTIEEGSGGWKVFSDKSFAQLNAQDGDNGYIGFVGNSAGSAGSIITGRYKLEGITGSALVFYTYPTGVMAQNNNSITVSVDDGSGWKDVKEIFMKDLLEDQAWNKVTVSLKEYDGKTIQLKLKATCRSYVYTYADNLCLAGINSHELRPMSVVNPYTVNPNEGYNVDVYVANHGIETTGEYKVQLTRNNKLVAETTGNSLKCGEIAKYSFPDKLDITNDRVHYYKAKVVYAQNPSSVNSESDEVMTTLLIPSTPVVKDLSAKESSEGAVLSWSQPDLNEALPAEATEDFESYTPWSWGTQLGEWTLVDKDQQEIGGPTQFSFPNIPNIGKGALSYFVMDSSWEQIASSDYYKAFSGKQYLSNMYCYTGMQNDDWIISPELCGAHQIVTIKAKSFDSRYPEALEILYSMTDKNPDSFIHAVSYDPLPEDWTTCSAVVPAGAKYFAVRAQGYDAFMMFLDDFSYVPKGAPENLNVKGYHVYRDGEKISETPVTTTSFVDGVKDTQLHKYFVTVVYDEKGESAGSNVVDLARSGMNSVVNDFMKISVSGHRVMVSGATGHVSVVNAAGMMIYSAKADPTNVIDIPSAGVYIVKDDNSIRKVIVK